MFKLRASLKTRILFLIGTVIIVLMLSITSFLILQWRKIIINKQSENALSISKTFAVTVIDALILEEKASIYKESVLENYIDNFMMRIGNVKYVAIFNRDDVSLLQMTKNGDATNKVINLDLKPLYNEITRINEDDQFGWTLSVNQPLIFSDKHWGTAIIGFDAQPIRDEIRNIFFILLFATVLITLIVLLILFNAINHMTSSLEKLVVEIDKIDFVSDVDISLPAQNDEIGFLYHHFNLLKERLDVSKKDLQNAQKQIYHAEKLASIGRLASGVAHQVNNPLNGIKSCLYSIQQEPDNINQTREYLALIDEGIDNIESVVKKLLGFARQQSISENFIDINESILKVVHLFDYRLKEKNIEVKLDLAKDLYRVKIDYHLFQEVIMNLLLNSHDAIEKTGTISISTHIENESSIAMQISDTGCGISPEDIKKIYEPFFTTKEVGTGTGLGLSVCLGIIESHDGRIVVESTLGKGTTFKVILPILERNEITNN